VANIPPPVNTLLYADVPSLTLSNTEPLEFITSIAFVFEDESGPLIESRDAGVVEPIPTFPLDARKSDDVAVIELVFEKYGNCPVVPE
jgi:hypothetical protein